MRRLGHFIRASKMLFVLTLGGCPPGQGCQPDCEEGMTGALVGWVTGPAIRGISTVAPEGACDSSLRSRIAACGSGVCDERHGARTQDTTITAQGAILKFLDTHLRCQAASAQPEPAFLDRFAHLAGDHRELHLGKSKLLA